MTTTLEPSDTPAIDTQEPTPEGLKEVITALPLVRIPNLIRDEYCNRCDRKNDIRRRYDLPERDPNFDDGERVTLICGYNADPDQTNGWEIRAAHHTDHPTKDKDDVATPGQAVAEVTARLDRDGWTYTQSPIDGEDEPYENHVEDRSVVRDVEIVWFSPVDEGQERERTVELDDEGIADPKPTDPIPDWPDEENEWRREIIEELGNEGEESDGVPTYGYETVSEEEIDDDARNTIAGDAFHASILSAVSAACGVPCPGRLLGRSYPFADATGGRWRSRRPESDT